MPYTFRLTMGGLCLFDVNREAGVVQALLVETDAKKVQHGGLELLAKQLRHKPELHAPMLLYPCTALPGMSATANNVGDRQGQWRLKGEEISVLVTPPPAAGAAPGLKLGDLEEQKSGLPTGLGDRSFAWVPELGKVVEAGNVIEDCLEDNPQLGYLSGRVHIADFGELKVKEFAQWNGKDVLVDFTPALDDRPIAKQAIPHRVTWRIEVPDESPGVPGKVEIQSRKFFQPKTDKVTVLTLQPAAGVTDVEVTLVNLCCGNYLAEDIPEPETLEPDIDFLCFYMLLDNFGDLSADNALPFPVGAKLIPTLVVSGGQSGINCSMARVTRPKL